MNSQELTDLIKDIERLAEEGNQSQLEIIGILQEGATEANDAELMNALNDLMQEYKEERICPECGGHIIFDECINHIAKILPEVQEIQMKKLAQEALDYAEETWVIENNPEAIAHVANEYGPWFVKLLPNMLKYRGWYSAVVGGVKTFFIREDLADYFDGLI